MLRFRFLSSLFFIFSTFLNLEAQVSLTSAPNSRSITAAPLDYATESFGNPWDMDSKADLADYIIGSDIQSPTFSVQNGLLNMTGGYFHLLAPGQCSSNRLGRIGANFPIDTNRYRFLNVRLYSESPSAMKVFVNYRCDYFGDYWQSVGIPTLPGWHTYTIDMESIGKETVKGIGTSWRAGPATGLRLDPSVDGKPVLIDWVTLVAPPAQDQEIAIIDATTTGPTPYIVGLDNDSDIGNGFLQTLLWPSTSSIQLTVNSNKLVPGSYNAFSVSSFDFGSLTRDPWDFTSINDIGRFENISETSFSSDGFRGLAGNGNYFFLNTHSLPINASLFKFLSLSVNVDKEGGIGLFARNAAGTVVAQSIGQLYANVGNNNLQVNLANIAGWSGEITSLQIAFFSPNTRFRISSMSLRSNGFGSHDASPTVSYANNLFRVNAPPVLKIFQPDSLGGEDFASAVLGDPWNMDSNSDIFALFNTQNAALLFNNSALGTVGNFYRGTSIANDFDPHQLSFFEPLSTRPAIDTSRYKNLTWRFITDRPQDINLGSVVRLVWHVRGEAQNRFYNSEDIVTFDGFQTYAADMSKIVLEELEHPPGSYPPQPWQGSVDYLRVDPHEFSIPTTFYYDWVRVTADDEANSQFAIKFSTKDIDNVGSNVTTIFYYSATNPSSGGTEIGRVTLNGSSYLLWDTSQVPNGSYFVYGIVTDGLNSTTAKASGKITINHSRPQDTTLPILFLDAPLQNSTVYNNFVLKGYALDNIQTAGGQLYIDNVLISEFSTGLFDSRAQEAYRSLAESGNAGFYHPLDLSFLSPGPHFIEVKVYDTAGNVTSNVVQVIKSQGSDPNPLQPPVALNLPEVKRTVGDNGVNIPDNTKGPTPTPTPTRTATPRAPNNSPSPRLPPSPSPLPNSLALSVKAPRGRKILEATVTKGSKCKRVTVVGALTANLLETSGSGVQLGGKKGSARTVFRLSNLRRRFSGAKNIFLRAFCDSTSVSRVRKVKLPR